MRTLTLQFVQHHEFDKLDEEEKVNKLLSIVKSNKILVLDGRLKAEEEAALIKMTMEQINKRFKGIEIATLNPSTKTVQGLSKLRLDMASILLGRRQGLTVIGPASIVKEMRKDPNKILLFTTRK